MKLTSTIHVPFLVGIGSCLYAIINGFKCTSSVNREYLMKLKMIADGRVPLMGGNWKLNPVNLNDAAELAAGVAKLTADVTDVDVVIFPPIPYLLTVDEQIKNSIVKLGAQNCYFESSGAYTGAVSTEMVKSLNAEYVLCGHSERRLLFGDNDKIINNKVKKALRDGLKPVLCVGETQEEYEAGLNEAVCSIQITNGLATVPAESMNKVAIAYEPVWAIGTGLVCPKEEAQSIHKFIRSCIAKKYGEEIAKQVIIQYGGSVKPDNVKELMAMPDIDGCLVGGASLTAESFAQIVRFKELSDATEAALTTTASATAAETAVAATATVVSPSIVQRVSKRARVKRFLKALLPAFMKK